jgi:hypothetical protein
MKKFTHCYWRCYLLRMGVLVHSAKYLLTIRFQNLFLLSRA